MLVPTQKLDSIVITIAVIWSIQNEKDEMSINPSFGKRGGAVIPRRCHTAGADAQSRDLLRLSVDCQKPGRGRDSVTVSQRVRSPVDMNRLALTPSHVIDRGHT